MSELRFRLNMVPPTTTSQQKRAVVIGGKPRFFQGSAQKAAEDSFYALLLPHRPAVPLSGPLALTVVLTWPWRACDGKAVRSHGRAWKTTKPDWSNWIKGFEDCLVRLRFIEDDALVCDGRVLKYWGDEPGVEVSLRRLEEL